MKRALIVGVMGGGHVPAQCLADAYELGSRIAEQGWILLNGGRDAGIMAASSRGAAEHGGLTIGVLPGADRSQAAAHVQIPICTGMGSGRNIINVLSSDIVVACQGSAGTVSEIALALKHGKAVITLNFEIGPLFTEYKHKNQLISANSPERVIQLIQEIFHMTDAPRFHG
jgi:uncharacterized protein (TIGR00725 family)